MKKYILVAGVNGAGKSTLYHILDELHGMPRVNTDEIVSTFGKWNNPSDVMKAGKIAVKQIDMFFKNGESFNQETTLCGKSIIKNIQRAKAEGYFVEVHYVGIDSMDLAKERVHHRVAKGGHGISDSDIERRYIESFKNLAIILNKCDLITFYDNTAYFERFALYKNGKEFLILKSVPEWFNKFIKKYRNGEQTWQNQ